MIKKNDKNKTGLSRFFRRGICENIAISVIGLGIFMLMQSFSMLLFTYSFIVILIGTLSFMVVSHFPE